MKFNIGSGGMHTYELFDLSPKEAAKVAGTVTWCIRKEMESGKINTEDVINKLKEVLGGFSDKERDFGWYLAGCYMLSAIVVGANLTTSMMIWYSEILNSHDELEKNISSFERYLEGYVYLLGDNDG